MGKLLKRKEKKNLTSVLTSSLVTLCSSACQWYSVMSIDTPINCINYINTPTTLCKYEEGVQ